MYFGNILITLLNIIVTDNLPKNKKIKKMCQIFIGKKGRSSTHLAKIKDLGPRNQDELWEENKKGVWGGTPNKAELHAQSKQGAPP